MTRDVTNEILRFRQQYGGSDNTNPANVVANKSLNYVTGNSIQNPVIERVTVAPAVINFNNSVGLFGTENIFIKVVVAVSDTVQDNRAFNADRDDYFFARIDQLELDALVDYTEASIDYQDDLAVENDYSPASISEGRPSLINPVVTCEIENVGVNNIYIDRYVDVVLYGPDRKPIGTQTAYVPDESFFYVGIHARRTKRLPFNVRLTLGRQYLSITEVTPTPEQPLLSSSY